MKRAWPVIVLLGFLGALGLCVWGAFFAEGMVALIAAIGLRLAYAGGPDDSIPPITPSEWATVDQATRGVFRAVLGRELALLGVATVLAYCFWRLARKARRPSPPWLIWLLRAVLAFVCACSLIYPVLWGYDLPSFLATESAHLMLMPVLVCVVAFTGLWATLGVSRWSWHVLLACLVLLSVHELEPLLRYAFRSLTDPWFHGSPGYYGKLAIVLPALVVVAFTNRSVASHLRRPESGSRL